MIAIIHAYRDGWTYCVLPTPARTHVVQYYDAGRRVVLYGTSVQDSGRRILPVGDDTLAHTAAP